MATRNPSNRNLWIIAALVVLSAAILAWSLGSGSLPGASVAEVGIAPPPSPVTAQVGGT